MRKRKQRQEDAEALFELEPNAKVQRLQIVPEVIETPTKQKHQQHQQQQDDVALVTPYQDYYQDKGNMCPICQDVWYTVSKQNQEQTHFVVSAQCGHLFGFSCIRQWLQHQKDKGEPQSCPICKQLTAQSQLFAVFFTASVAQSDAYQQMKEQKERKKQKLVSKLANAKKEHKRLAQGIDKLLSGLAVKKLEDDATEGTTSNENTAIIVADDDDVEEVQEVSSRHSDAWMQQMLEQIDKLIEDNG